MAGLISNTKLAAFLVVICILLTGCNQIESGLVPESIPLTNKEVVKRDTLMDQGPVRGGTLQLFSTYPDTLNPILTTNKYVKEMLSTVYEGLTKLDNQLNPVPVLAEKWSVSQDLNSWTFYIKKDISWHDNIPLTAEDVEFTLDAILKQGWQSPYRSCVENIAAFAAIDKYTFRISLKTPNPFMAEMMTFPILAKHYYLGENVANSEKNLKPMGTGPYKFVAYEPKKSVSLIMNDKWWGAKGTKQENILMPYIMELKYKLYESGKESINAFQASEIDVSSINEVDVSKYRGRQDLTIRKYPNRNYNYISFNLSKPALSVKEVRQAIAYGIDKNKIQKDILLGQATLSDMPALPNTWINDRTKNFYDFDPEKSKRILSEDGWRTTSYGQYRYVNGSYAQLTFELLVNNENDSRVKVANYIAEELGRIGIQVRIKSVDFNTFMGLISSKSYDMALVGTNIPLTPDYSFLFASWNTKPTANYCFNISGYNSSDMDNLLGKLMYTKGTLEDGLKMKQIYSDIRNLAMEDLPYIGLYFDNDSMAFNKKARGEISPTIIDRFNNISKWYLP